MNHQKGFTFSDIQKLDLPDFVFHIREAEKRLKAENEARLEAERKAKARMKSKR